MLDDAFRRRVGQVMAADDGELDDAARARIVAFVAANGTGLVRRARRTRTALLVAGPLLAAAAVLSLWVRHESRYGAEQSVAVTTAPSGGHASLACAARSVPATARAGFVTSASGSVLDLGQVAVAAATAGSAVRLTEVAACRTLIALDSGTVMVHAKDLGGGELRVRAPSGEVTVHGTLFAVTERPDAFIVEVVEGHVGVVDKAGSQTVSAGERLFVSALGVAKGQLSSTRVLELRGAVGGAPQPEVVGLDALEPYQPSEAARNVPSGPSGTTAPRAAQRAPADETPPMAASAAPETVELRETAEAAPPKPAAVAAASSDPLSLAEAARRAGDFQHARELYRKAGDGVGVTAEAAWVALARMELSLGHTSSALEATKRRQASFGRGTLEPEALWIDVRAYRQTGDMSRARTLAADLVHRWPASPQGRAAQQWLSGE